MCQEMAKLKKKLADQDELNKTLLNRLTTLEQDSQVMKIELMNSRKRIVDTEAEHAKCTDKEQRAFSAALQTYLVAGHGPVQYVNPFPDMPPEQKGPEEEDVLTDEPLMRVKRRRTKDDDRCTGQSVFLYSIYFFSKSELL